MSELKAVHAFDVYEAYTKTGNDDAAQVYLKSEADRYIAYLKYRRCLALADMCKDRAAAFDAYALCCGSFDRICWYRLQRDKWSYRTAKFRKLALRYKEYK